MEARLDKWMWFVRLIQFLVRSLKCRCPIEQPLAVIGVLGVLGGSQHGRRRPTRWRLQSPARRRSWIPNRRYGHQLFVQSSEWCCNLEVGERLGVRRERLEFRLNLQTEWPRDCLKVAIGYIMLYIYICVCVLNMTMLVKLLVDTTCLLSCVFVYNCFYRFVEPKGGNLFRSSICRFTDATPQKIPGDRHGLQRAAQLHHVKGINLRSASRRVFSFSVHLQET